MQDEESLIQQAQAGDHSALNELVASHWQAVYRFIAYKTGKPDEAQELTQETFFRAFRALEKYRHTGAAFKTFLNHIALNLIRDTWRKQSRSPEIIELGDYQQAAATDLQPDMQVISQERRQAIERVMQLLPSEQRQTVELRIIAGLPVRDTAAALGKSEAAIKMLQQRALKNLRALLLEHKIIETDGKEV